MLSDYPWIEWHHEDGAPWRFVAPSRERAPREKHVAIPEGILLP